MSSPTRRSVLRGLALAATATAMPLPALAASPAPSGGEPAPPLRQMRGMWIASVLNINWPSRPGLTPEQQRAEYLAWLDLAVARRLNSVFVQIRPTADAFWPSPYEPWSQYLTGVQGRDPGAPRSPRPQASGPDRVLRRQALLQPRHAGGPRVRAGRDDGHRHPLRHDGLHFDDDYFYPLTSSRP
ncbi:family 10 glycosylhydrolase [Sphaerimonospora mesophila]|uniref:family 10 glycosylhydrolase n=1 Tax=Sphaerimonospora mesophila TaxID=37483 RepID=UPI000AF4D9E8